MCSHNSITLSLSPNATFVVVVVEEEREEKERKELHSFSLPLPLSPRSLRQSSLQHTLLKYKTKRVPNCVVVQQVYNETKRTTTVKKNKKKKKRKDTSRPSHTSFSRFNYMMTANHLHFVLDYLIEIN